MPQKDDIKKKIDRRTSIDDTLKNTRFPNIFHKLQVAWVRQNSKAVLAINTHMVTKDPRISVAQTGSVEHSSWTLNIQDVQLNDSGFYKCQVNTEPMMSQVKYLISYNCPNTLRKSQLTNLFLQAIFITCILGWNVKCR